VVVGAATPAWRRPDRLALVAFAGLEFAAVPVLLHLGRRRWFQNDDWALLVRARGGWREAFDSNIWGHWITLPVLAYRLGWWLVGLRHYTPYLLSVILSHLAVVALLRVVMRRCGAGPWVSTIAASMFVFFGAGGDAILNPVQISFNGSLVFGLSQLLLADHDGPVDRRDFFGLACGLAGLMCSNVAIAMVASVGLACLLSRGWRIAMLHTAPLAVIYIAWWSVFAAAAKGLFSQRASIGELSQFMWSNGRAVLSGLGGVSGVGFLLLSLLAVGLVLAHRQAPGVFSRESSSAIALLVGAAVFNVTVGAIRAGLGGSASMFASTPRYVYVGAAMVLPALAVATTAVIRRRRLLAPLALAMLLIGIPANFHELATRYDNFPTNYARTFSLYAYSPMIRRIPKGSSVPLPGARAITVDFLKSAAASGHLVRPRDLRRGEAATAALHLALQKLYTAPRGRCRRSVSTAIILLSTNDEIVVVRGTASIIYVTPQGASFPWRLAGPLTLRALTGPLSLRLVAADPAALCVQRWVG
jgi:hypothetical protein